MKSSGYILYLGVALVAGCSNSDSDVPPPAPPAPAPAVAPVASSTAATPAAPASDQQPVQAEGEVEPQLKPIQMAIESFEAQNKRMPMNVDELVKSGVIKSLPPPPPGMIYFIDQGTKRIRLGGRD